MWKKIEYNILQIAYLSPLEKFFEMKKGQCKDALEIYKRFLTRMTRVSEFLKVAEVSNSKPVWEYNLKLLTLLSGVHSRVYK